MLTTGYIIAIFILLTIGILYRRYLEKKARNAKYDNYNEVKNYLLNESSLAKSKKPIMWIYTPYEYNARDWLSFGSRSSYDLNQPYLNLCVRSIIQCCDQSFTICIIDDNSFAKLIPGWTIDLGKISDPLLSYVRQLAIGKLIYHYGGMVTPISFLCFKDLIDLYQKGTGGEAMFVCENVTTNISATNNLFYPDTNFMGATKNNDQMREFIQFMERVISNDYTAQAEFLGTYDKWVNKKVKQNKIRLIVGTDVGTKTVDEEAVIVDTLLSEDYIHFYPSMCGIWIPAANILKRTNYEWFARMSPEQIFQSNFILAKYFVLALAPDSKMGVIEPLTGKNGEKPDWISFWQVPISSTLPVFGPMPIGIGNNVPKFHL
jgi:hypothetical protein